MRTLIATTEDFIKQEKDILTADISAGSIVILNVLSSTNFAIDDWIVVGIEGSETAEICQITAIGDITITVGNLKLAHKKDEQIIKYRYNKRKFYGALTENGSYSQLTSSGSPVEIMINNPQGTLLEYTGIEGFTYFKSTYFNSQTSDETSIDDAEAVLADESLRYCSIYAIRKQAGLTNNPYITDGVIEIFRKRAENEVNSYLFNGYQLPLQDSNGNYVIPFIVENCTTLLAAGYMDYQEFGKDGEGKKWLGESRSILKKIQRNEQRLIDADGNEYTSKTTSSTVQSYPNSVDNNNGPIRLFTMDQKF